MKRQTKNGDIIELDFYVPPKEFLATINQIKSIAGKVWDPKEKIWTVPFSIENSRQLEKFGFSPYGEIAELLHPHVARVKAPTPQVAVDFTNLPQGLRPYQKEAIQFLEAVKGRGILALAARLGKTLVALCYAKLHKNTLPMVVCCPASIKINWSREVEKWTDFSYHIITGTQPYKLPKKDVYIINYDILHDHMDSFESIGLLCVDESHRISNTTLSKKGTDGKTIRVPVQCTVAFYHIAKKAEHVIFLSGTPITSSAKQLFVPLNVFLPEHFPNQYKFQWRYCAPARTRWGMTFDGLSHEEELFEHLDKIMFRRRREDVFTDLPKESHEFVELEIDQDEYEAELEEFKVWASKHPGITEEQVNEKLSKFTSLSYSRKATQIKEWLQDLLQTGEKVVVFTWHKTVSEDLHKTFKKESVLMYGETSMVERQEAIDKFNTDPKCLMFIGNIQASKEGITLAAADIACFVEIPFVPGDLEQAQQRIWLPQKSNPLSYIYFVAKGTVDGKRIKRLLTRNKLISTLLDGKPLLLFGGTLLEEICK